MATRDRVIKLPDDAYELLRLEAARRGVEPDALAESLLREDLTHARFAANSTLGSAWRSSSTPTFWWCSRSTERGSPRSRSGFAHSGLRLGLAASGATGCAAVERCQSTFLTHDAFEGYRPVAA